MGAGGLQKLFNPEPVVRDNYGKSDAQKAKDATQNKKDLAFKKEFYDRVSRMRTNQGPQFQQPPQQYAPTQPVPQQPQQQFGTIQSPGQPVQTQNFGRNAGVMPQGLHRPNRGNPQGGLIGGGQ